MRGLGVEFLDHVEALLSTRLAGRPRPEREIAQLARDVDPRLLEHDDAAGARSNDTQLAHTIRATLDPWRI